MSTGRQFPDQKYIRPPNVNMAESAIDASNRIADGRAWVLEDDDIWNLNIPNLQIALSCLQDHTAHRPNQMTAREAAIMGKLRWHLECELELALGQALNLRGLTIAQVLDYAKNYSASRRQSGGQK